MQQTFKELIFAQSISFAIAIKQAHLVLYTIIHKHILVFVHNIMVLYIQQYIQTTIFMVIIKVKNC